MSEYHRSVRIRAPRETVFQWHARHDALDRLLPPWERIEIVERPAGIHDGARTVFRARVGPASIRWVAVFEDVRPPEAFTDVQVRGPFRAWRHVHRFHPADDGASELEDRVAYDEPLGALGRAAAGRWIRRRLDRMFRYRHRVTAMDVERHGETNLSHPLRVAVSGSTGLVGSNLTAFLGGGGHEVRRLVRREPEPGGGEVFWDPKSGRVDAASLEGLDAVVHLAGRSIFAPRWTPQVKQDIRDSRVEGTKLLAGTLARLRRPPKVLVAASAVGYYGERGDQVLEEDSSPGRGFLAQVCQQWEAATEPAKQAGVRVVHLRIGVVLSRRGGALASMLPAFRLGLGGPVGAGRQWVPWIALEDLLGAVLFCMTHSTLSGPVNAVAPEPVRQRDLARTLGRVLHRPSVVPLPRWMVRALFGEMGRETLLASARVSPRRLLDAGFRHRFPDLEDCLRFEMGREAF